MKIVLILVPDLINTSYIA